MATVCKNCNHFVPAIVSLFGKKYQRIIAPNVSTPMIPSHTSTRTKIDAFENLPFNINLNILSS